MRFPLLIKYIWLKKIYKKKHQRLRKVKTSKNQTKSSWSQMDGHFNITKTLLFLYT